jgi:hypothetical protein
VRPPGAFGGYALQAYPGADGLKQEAMSAAIGLRNRRGSVETIKLNHHLFISIRGLRIFPFSAPDYFR